MESSFKQHCKKPTFDEKDFFHVTFPYGAQKEIS